MENNKIIISGYSYWESNPDEHLPILVRPEAFDVPIKSQTLCKEKGNEFTVIEFEKPLTKMSSEIFPFIHRPKPGTESEPREWDNTERIKRKIDAITLPDTLVDYLPDSYSTSRGDIAYYKPSILGKYAQRKSLWVIDGVIKFWSERIIDDLGVRLNELTGIKEVPPYFYSNIELKGKLILPEGLEKIGEHSFSGIEELKEIKLPKSLKVIPAYAMSNNRWVIKVNLANVEEFGEFTFSRHVLSKVKFGKKLKKIGEGAFSDRVRGGQPLFEGPEEFVKENGRSLICQDLEIMLPSCNYINLDTSSYNVRKYIVPEGIVRLGAYSGMDCGVLTLPNTLKYINKNAFAKNCYFKIIKLPESLEYIGEEAFLGCKSLTSIIT